jgi:hypothetical protein
MVEYCRTPVAILRGLRDLVVPRGWAAAGLCLGVGCVSLGMILVGWTFRSTPPHPMPSPWPVVACGSDLVILGLWMIRGCAHQVGVDAL